MKTTKLTQRQLLNALDFAAFLTTTLGPDLLRSGHEYTGKDVVKAGKLLNRLACELSDAKAGAT